MTEHDEVEPGEVTTIVVHPAELSGRVALSGAKNSALRLLAASLLFSDDVVLDGYPMGLLDTIVHAQMLEHLGKQIDLAGGSCTISEPRGLDSTLEWDGRSIRNTLLILGALVARLGEGRVPLPGGCDLGGRPHDLHQQLLEAAGARVWIEGGYLCARLDPGRRVHARYSSRIRSTGVTENALLLGSVSPEGVTLDNPHLTPEVLDLAAFLRRSGASIDVRGNRQISVRGSGELRGGVHEIMRDRIEAVTFAALAIAGRGDVQIDGYPQHLLGVPAEYLRVAGARIYSGQGSVIVRSDGVEPFSLSAGSDPAVHSDMQPLFGALAVLADGYSEIADLRYPKRFDYMRELGRLGASAKIEDGRCLVDGSLSRVRKGEVTAPDLRGGVALAVAAVGAEGPVTIRDAWQILRGYENFVEKLRSLGCEVETS